MFSPYYAWSGRKNPENHVAINVALYDLRERSSFNRWAMTERTSRALRRDAASFAVGPSSLHWANSQHWDGDDLVIDVNEITVPIPRKLKGQIRFTPACRQPTSFALDRGAHHHWWPYAPFGRISAQFSAPDLTWQGHGYSDTNTGTAALEKDFSSWTWSRTQTQDGAILLYEPREKDGFESTIAVTCQKDGNITTFDPPPEVKLPNGFWGVTRETRSDGPAKLIQTLENAPFYTRSVVETMLDGTASIAVHESLNLDRFANPIVKMMLPFRMPRRFW